MKCQILFSGESKKNISKYHLLVVLPSMLSVLRNVGHLRPQLYSVYG